MLSAVKILSCSNRPAKRWLVALTSLVLGAGLGNGATFNVTSTTDSGAGSLRQAILNANTTPGANLITFQISGGKPYTINLASALPAVTNTVTIDATTQTGYSNAPVVELNGTGAGSGSVGLQFAAAAPFSTVRGLVINRFPAQGIVLSGASNIVQGNFIGTDTNGLVARANGSYGIWVKSAGNLIGGLNPTNGNLISGGNDTGIYLSSASGNAVQGNLIGVTISGSNSLGNVNSGIMLDFSSGNLIGGTNAAARNITSGNGVSGIYLNGSGATGNIIQGNYVGVGISGSTVVSNAGSGITLSGAPGNLIGGTNAVGGNLISGNGQAGILLSGTGAANNSLCGNLIGTDATGKSALANRLAGVSISGGVANQIGGTNNAGNVISGNSQDGIFLSGGAAGNLVQGNFIGLSAAGTNAVRNGFNGISLNGAVSNTIGGTVAAARNIISGNATNGIGILQLADVANTILGNYIGTDFTGRLAISNVLAGIRVQGCSNVIGGTVSGSGNVISGNGQQGIWVVGVNGNVTGNVIQGNIIGLDSTGTNALANLSAGVGVSSASKNQIGGTTAGARNVISGNGLINSTASVAGVFFIGSGTTGNQLLGNYIGTDSSGMLARGNVNDGIHLEQAATNFIGGTVAGSGNLISGNGVDGLYLTNSSWNLIQGNYIGTRADGSNALGNVFHNIELQINATNNTIGGMTAGAGNRIAFAQTSLRSGVRVRDGSLNNLISGNAIFSNALLGIDLGTFGVTANVACESGVAANAANAGQNYPVLSNACSNVGTQIRGMLNSAPNKTYALQFFANPAVNASGFGEGQVFLGQTSLTLGTGCSSNFSVFLPVSVPVGWIVTATATDAANNTSEFSAWVSVLPVPSLQIGSTVTNSGPVAISWTNAGGSFGLQQTYDLTPPVQWVTVTNTPILSNGLFTVTALTTNGNTFYRLLAQ